VYANQTDGEEIASICAHEDPGGAMHYYLEHDKEEEKSLCLKVNGILLSCKLIMENNIYL